MDRKLHREVAHSLDVEQTPAKDPRRQGGGSRHSLSYADIMPPYGDKTFQKIYPTKRDPVENSRLSKYENYHHQAVTKDTSIKAKSMSRNIHFAKSLTWKE